MASAENRHRRLIAVVGDEDTVSGVLLAGVGDVHPQHGRNFLVVDHKTSKETISSTFDTYTHDRKDIAIVLINQHIADMIRPKISAFTAAFPALLEIPSKDHPYKPENDSILQRVERMYND